MNARSAARRARATRRIPGSTANRRAASTSASRAMRMMRTGSPSAGTGRSPSPAGRAWRRGCRDEPRPDPRRPRLRRARRAVSAAWKQFERDVAALLGGRRFWANSGERLDVVSDSAIAQCKLVRVLSLEKLTQLAEEVEREAAPQFKAGVVAVKLRRGRGRPSPTLLIVTEATWRRMNGSATPTPE